MAISPRKYCLEGFTLIEVLVALAIVAIAMTAVIKAASQNIRATTHLQDKSMALWVGQMVLNEARIGTLVLPQAVFKDNVFLLERDWQIKAEKTPTANKRMEKIEVDVYPGKNEDKGSLIHLEGYLYHDEIA